MVLINCRFNAIYFVLYGVKFLIMKLRKAKEIIPDAVPIAVALGMSIYWLSTGYMIKNDPYLLGVFRGVIWSTLIVSHFRMWLRFLS